MMRKLILLFLLLGVFNSLSAQVPTEEIEGIVTYSTTQNVYVKFISAKKIKPGASLFIRKDGALLPALLVENCSSMSCVGKAVGDRKLNVGDVLIAVVPKDNEKKEDDTKKQLAANSGQDNTLSTGNIKDNKSKRKQNIEGRILLSSYSNISNLKTADSHRLRYTLSLNASNIANSPLSFESYISFAHKINDWAEIKENVFNGLKIYSLGLKYDLGKSTTISFGRKINPQISSLGAIDGLQVESKIGQLYIGGIAGFRPDYNDYSFNSKLLEYGGYIGHNYQNKNGNIQTSVAFLEQTNSGITDRRFAYFQHQNSLLKNLNLFVSSEIDLYKTRDGIPIDSLMLTSLYVSLNYRPYKKLSIMGSYDNRRNVIYYETYKSYLDMLLEDATRQGVQLRLNYRPFNFMFIGLSSSYRFRDNDIRPTENLNGFITFNQVPLIKASASLSANLLQTSYLNGIIYGLRLNKDLLDGKMSLGLNYRYVNYSFENGSNNLFQHIGEVDLSYNFSRKFSLSVDYELTLEGSTNYHRFYLSAIKRF